MESYGYWGRLSGLRSSRRRFLVQTLGVGSGVAAAALISCGGRGKQATTAGGAATAFATSTPAPAAEQPRRGGDFVMALTTPLNDIKDPHRSESAAAWIHCPMGNRAVNMNPDSKLIPELFASWEQVSPTELVAKTQPKAKWQNKGMEAGRAFTAEDAAYNLMRNAGLLDKPENKALYQRASCQIGMNRAVAVDDRTVKITFDFPASTFLAGLTDFRINFLSKERLVAGAFKEVEQVGTGPFIITKWENGVEVVMERNPDYWEAGLPYPDRFRYQWITDFNGQTVAFQQGKLSVLFANTKIARASIEKLMPNAIDNTYQSPYWGLMQFNVQRAPFNDSRVRKAIFLVPNYVEMGTALCGDKWALSGPIPQCYPEGYRANEIATMPGYNVKTKDADIKQAVELMTAAGYPDGAIKLGLMTAAKTGIPFENGIRVQAALKAVWPKMNVFMDQPPDSATDGVRRAAHDFDANTWTQNLYADALLEMAAQYGTSGSRNYGGVTDPAIDALIKQGYAATDPKARTEVLKKLQDHLLEKKYTTVILEPLPTYKEQPTLRGLVGTYPALGCDHNEARRSAKRAWFSQSS